MARSGVKVDEVIQAPGLPVGEVHDRLLAAMSADGDYQAVQVGSDRFQFARTFRPTWAIVTACITVWLVLIGIIFLLVKTTETCLAVVEADHRGTRLRLQGRISATALGRVRAAMAGEQLADVRNAAVPPRPLPGSSVAVGPVPAVGAPVASTFPEVERASAPVAPTGPSTPAIPASRSVQGPAPLPPQQAPAAPQPPAVAQQPAPAAVPQAGRSTLTPDQFVYGQSPGINDSEVVIPAPPPEPGAGNRARASAAAPGGVAAGPIPPQTPGGIGEVPAQQDWTPAVGTVDAENADQSSAGGSAGTGMYTPGFPHAVLDDGTSVGLSALTLIGRDPAPADGEDATLVPLDDPTRSVSKTHLAVVHAGDGWAVVDRNSTNGVTILGSDGTEVALSAGIPAPVADGTVVRFGERELRLVTSDRMLAGGGS